MVVAHVADPVGDPVADAAAAGVEARLTAAGLVRKKLVGAMASRSRTSPKRTRSAFTPSMPRLSTYGSTLDPKYR